CALRRGVVVIAEPDANRLMPGIADKPGVAIILAGTRLASRKPPGGCRRAARAPCDDLMKHIGHVARLLCGDDLRGHTFMSIEDVTILRLDALDRIRRAALAGIAENGIGGGEFKKRYFCAAKRYGKIAW